MYGTFNRVYRVHAVGSNLLDTNYILFELPYVRMSCSLKCLSRSATKFFKSVILYNLYSGLFTDIMRTIMESGSSIMAVMTTNTNFREYAKGVLDDCKMGYGRVLLIK